MKKLPMILCIFLTCAVILSSLLLPQAVFSLIDKNEEKKTGTEQAATLPEEIPQDEKLFMLMQNIDYLTQNTVRFTSFFIKSGQEIEEKDLFEVVKREMTKLDPSDSLGFFANLKIAEEKKIASFSLMNAVQYDSGAKAFPVWMAGIDTNGMTYQFMLDAITGRIFTVKVYLSPGEIPDTDASPENEGDAQLYKQMVQPNMQPEMLTDYAAYLFYDTPPPAWFYSDVSGIEGIACSVSEKKFSLAFYYTGYDWTLGPILY